MYSSARGDNDAAAEPSAEQASTRLSVADILSSMASTVDTTATGTTTFSTLDGLTSGIPTRTTPTLTPTTLKNIEESFLDLQTIPPAPMEHQHQAGFVPPVVNISVSTSGGSSLPYHPSSKNDDDDLWLSSCVQSSGELSPSSSVYQSDTAPCTTTTTTVTSKARNVGGRRPAKNDSLTPEEEERRRVRRERNKLAAARCRKRRMDHTNSLLKETEGLEAKKECLQQEIQILKSQKEELEFLLEAHKATCKMIKHHHHSNSDASLSSDSVGRGGNAGSPARKRGGANRPTSLPVSSAFGTSQQDSLKPSVSMSSETGVPISTPSTGIFNFESLMEGGIGLTPVSTELTLVVSSCSGQQRNSSSDLSSPDGVNPPKLVSL